MKKLITFTDERMTLSAHNLCKTALAFGGIEDYGVYDPNSLNPTWRAIQKDVLANERGAGCWCWKPAIILDAMLNMQTNDILIYCDAGCTITSSFQHIIDRMQEDIFLFGNGWKHVEWTKMDVLDLINHASFKRTDTMLGSFVSGLGELENAEQCQASLIFLRVTKTSLDFVKRWYAYSLMPGLIDDSPSLLPNVPTFADHRHDQSILTSLAIKYKIPLHWFPSHTNMHNPKAATAGYPILLEHHRKRNHEWL